MEELLSKAKGPLQFNIQLMGLSVSVCSSCKSVCIIILSILKLFLITLCLLRFFVNNGYESYDSCTWFAAFNYSDLKSVSANSLTYHWVHNLVILLSSIYWFRKKKVYIGSLGDKIFLWCIKNLLQVIDAYFAGIENCFCAAISPTLCMRGSSYKYTQKSPCCTHCLGALRPIIRTTWLQPHFYTYSVQGWDPRTFFP